jgi:hypothetical protein
MLSSPIDFNLQARLERLRFDYPNLLDLFFVISYLLKYHGPAYQALNCAEAELSEALVSQARERYGNQWFHGGRAGLQSGDLVLSQRQGAPRVLGDLERPFEAGQFAWVTPMAAFAMSFAIPVQGALYKVLPDDRLKVSPFHLRAVRLIMSWYPTTPLGAIKEFMMEDFVCGSAVVLEVCDPVVPRYPNLGRCRRPGGQVIRSQKEVLP